MGAGLFLHADNFNVRPATEAAAATTVALPGKRMHREVSTKELRSFSPGRPPRTKISDKDLGVGGGTLLSDTGHLPEQASVRVLQGARHMLAPTEVEDAN